MSYTTLGMFLVATILQREVRHVVDNFLNVTCNKALGGMRFQRICRTSVIISISYASRLRIVLCSGKPADVEKSRDMRAAPSM